MKWNLIYFDDLVQNIEVFKELLSDDFSVIGCQDATSFPVILEKYSPHAILLDVHMPVMDGHTLYKQIAEHPAYNGCPILFISGDISDENKLSSFEKGGVDFLPRHLKTEEIAIRLINKIKLFLHSSTLLELGNLRVDLKSMKATVNDVNVDLTLLELRMLSHILRTFPKQLTRLGLIYKVWGDETVKLGTINTHLTNLKPKIESWNHLIKVRDEYILIQKKS